MRRSVLREAQLALGFGRLARMVTDYAVSIGDWKEWQKAYRFGVLLVVPPDPPFSDVNEVRRLHDSESAAICAAHISLTVPLPVPLTRDHWEELVAIAARIPAFSVRYGPPISFPPHPGVCLGIEPRGRFEALLNALEAASVFAGAMQRSHPFTPHMTIAENVAPDQTQPLLDDLRGSALEGSFRCTSVALSVPDTDFVFTTRAELHLSA